LAVGLVSRLHHDKSDADLPELVEVSRRAVAATDKADRARAVRLATLYHVLAHHLYDRARDPQDLDGDAIRDLATVSQDLAEATPHEDEAYRGRARDAVNNLVVWAERSGDVAPMDDAIKWQRNVVEDYDPSDPDRVHDLVGVAVLLGVRLNRWP